MALREIRTEQLSNPAGRFSQAILVEGVTDVLYMSGLTARDIDGNVVAPGDITAQTETILANMGYLLEAAGATFADVVKVTVFITDMGLFDAIHEVRARYFTPPYPASTMVEVSRLVLPGQLIEIEALAALGHERHAA